MTSEAWETPGRRGAAGERGQFSTPLLLGLALLGFAVVFAIDLALPAGWAVAAPYILLVVGAAWQLRRKVNVFLFSGLATVLTIIGFLAKASPGESPIYAANRALAIAGVWAVAGMLRVAARGELALRDGEARLHAIVDTAVDAIVTIDEAGTVQSCNAALTRLFGYAPEEVIGRNVSMLMPSPYREEHDGYLASYLTTGRRRIIGIGREVSAQRKDGSVFPIDLSVSEFWLGDQRFFTGLIHDVTDRKESEAALARANRNLDEKNRELQNIVYVTSHDLRSPLVNIQGFGRELERSCERIKDLLANESSPAPATREELARTLETEIPEALHFVLTSATKMDALLNGLLRLSRLGRAALHFERLDMNRLVHTIVVSMEFQVQQIGARVEVDDLPPCSGDAVQVGQVFSNLVDNAIKYRDPLKPLVVRISGKVEGDRAVYRVSDNGIGIAPAHQRRVFEIFHRLDLSRAPGEGLGLTIAQRILERHDGAIELESRPGEGTTFIVSLPRRQAARENAA